MSSISIWLEATRPKTLSAALIPVSIGSTLALKDGQFHVDVLVVGLICALLIQIGTNFANDYFDFKKGADTDERLGFKRATASGLISPEAMLKGTFATMALAFFCGLYLVWIGGWVIFGIGIASLAFGILYTGGPFPLAYNGLGDLFVFLFFGIVAVNGTYFAHTLNWSWEVLWASMVPAALCTNLLVVNNLRDTETDKKANKRTLGVLFGDSFLRFEYLVLLMIAFGIPPHLMFWNDYNLWILLPYLTLPLAIKNSTFIFSIKDKRELNNQLAETSKLLILFGFLLCLGIGFNI